MSNPLRIDFACNDPDDGLFAGCVRQIDISDNDPVLELEDWDGRAFRVTDSHIFVSGFKVPYKASKEWLGNWCWNAYWIAVPDAVRLLEGLHRRRLFDCTCGDSRLFNRWKCATPFDALSRRLFHDVLERVAARQAVRRL